MKFPYKFGGSLFAVGLLYVVTVNSIQNKRLQPLLVSPQGRASASHEMSRSESIATYKILVEAWQKRHEKDVSDELIPLTKTANIGIRRRAVCALGRIESTKALPILKALAVSLGSPSNVLKTGAKNDSDWNHAQEKLSPTLPLAIARISARTLRGEKKINSVLKDVGLTLKDVEHLSHQLKNNPRGESTGGYEILCEVTDMLYAMAAQGENIETLSKRLELSPSQRFRLHIAPLPAKEEAAEIIRYMSTLNSIDSDSSRLIECLLDLGPVIHQPLMKQITAVRDSPTKFGDQGFVLLFRTAALTHDKQYMPILSEIMSLYLADFKAKRKPGQWICFYASQAKGNLPLLSRQPLFPPD